MWKKITIIIVLVAILLVISLFDQQFNKNKVEAPVIQQQEDQTDFVEPLTVKYQYKDGVHTFIGDIELPSSCYSYNAVIKDSEDPNVKILSIDYAEEENGENCSDETTTVSFRVSVEGSKDLEFKLLENGVARRLNVFEVPADVDIDQFELFMKG